MLASFAIKVRFKRPISTIKPTKHLEAGFGKGARIAGAPGPHEDKRCIVKLGLRWQVPGQL